MKHIEYNAAVRQKIKAGIDKVADAVRITLGPRGRNVILDKEYGHPTITNDGVSIAKEVELEDKFENLGAKLIKQVAERTNDVAGDGTTTSTVLTQAMVREGLKLVETGLNPIGIRLGMEEAKNDVVRALKESAKKVTTKDEICQVATISAESPEIGRLIADAVKEIGADGVITTEQSNTVGLSKDIVKGVRFNKGYISPYFATNPQSNEAEVRDAYVLITDKKISAAADIIPVLEKVAATGKKNIVVIAEDVDAEALATLVVNKVRGILSVLAVKAPEFGDQQRFFLEDIATLTGGKVITQDLGTKLSDVTLDMLGKASRVVSSKDETTIIGGKGKKADIDTAVIKLRIQIENEKSLYFKDKLKGRLARLLGGICVINVGAPTETELTYLQHKLEDTINATKAAVAEGIVCGGGVALAKLSHFGPSLKEDVEFQAGYSIVIKSLSYPLKQIVENTGKQSPDVVFDQVVKNKGEHYGYNAKLDRFEKDMIKAGIVDPVKVTRSAVENAVSVAALLLTTEAAIVIEEDKKDNK